MRKLILLLPILFYTGTMCHKSYNNDMNTAPIKLQKDDAFLFWKKGKCNYYWKAYKNLTTVFFCYCKNQKESCSITVR